MLQCSFVLDEASVEYQLLDSKIGELTDVESVLAAAIDGVDRAEFLEQPSGTAKFAQDRSVQAHLQYLAGDIDVVPRIGIGNVEDGGGTLVHAHRLWIGDVRKHGLEDAVVVKHLDPMVAAITRVHVALPVHRNAENIRELAGSCASLAPGLYELSVLVELGDSRVAGTIGDQHCNF